MACANVAENQKVIERLAGEAAESTAEIIVLPEASMRFFGPPTDRLQDFAESLEGTFVANLKSLAKRHSMIVVAGIFERADHELAKVYNTIVAVDSDGQLIGSYRKVHLFDAFGARESDRIKAGGGQLLVFERGGLKFGVLTCYDIRFPEIARKLVDEGVTALIVPTAWRRGILKESQWLTLARARALENTCWLIGSAQVGGAYCGNSLVVDPMGTVVARLGEESGILVAEMPPERVSAVREKLPVLQHRRYDVVFKD
jgi:deaminated glutathione amidase